MNYTIGKKTTPPEERELSEKTLAVAVSETEIQFGEVIEITEKETPGVLQNISMLSTTTQTSEPEAPDFAGVQFTNPQNGYYNMRLVSQIKTLNYQSLGYEIHSKYGNDAPVSQILFSKTAYTSLNAGGTTLYPSEGFDYFVVNVIENIPENTIASFIIKPFAITLEGQCLYGNTKTFSSKNAQMIDYVAFEAPTPGLKTIKQCRIRKEMSMDDSAILKDSSGTNVKLNVGDTVPLLSPTTISANGRVWYRILYNGMMLYVTADDESFKEVYVSAPQVPTGRDIIANPGVGSNIKIRSTPTEVNGNIIAQVAHGTNLTLTCSSPQNQTWYAVYVQLSNGTYSYGWSSGEYLGNYIEYGTLVDVDKLTVRSGAGTGNASLGTIYKGTTVEVLEKNCATGSGYTWHKILYNGSVGYVVAGNNTPNFTFETRWVALVTPTSSNPTYSVSSNGVEMLKKLEGFSATAYIASPSESLYTIGYGHVITDGTTSVTINGKTYSTLTEELATILLQQDLNNTFMPRFNSFLQTNNIVLNQSQYDACIMDCYQKGQNIWANQVRLIAKFILAKQYFDNYDKVLTAFLDGTTNTGLINRRTKEAKLFVYNTYS